MGVPCCCSKCELVAFAANVFCYNEVFCSAAAVNMAPTPMDFFDLANLLDNDGNLQNEMMVASFAATMLATIPVLLGNEFDVNVGLKKRKKREEEGGEEAGMGEKYEEEEVRMGGKGFLPSLSRQSTKFLPSSNPL